MFRIQSNFIPLESFFTGMNDTPSGNDFYREGNDDLKYKSITLLLINFKSLYF
jgi:hypothetical protein